MKSDIFNMRMSSVTKDMLDKLSLFYNLSASATVDYIIAKEYRTRENQIKTALKLKEENE